MALGSIPEQAKHLRSAYVEITRRSELGKQLLFTITSLSVKYLYNLILMVQVVYQDNKYLICSKYFKLMLQ